MGTEDKSTHQIEHSYQPCSSIESRSKMVGIRILVWTEGMEADIAGRAEGEVVGSSEYFDTMEKIPLPADNLLKSC